MIFAGTRGYLDKVDVGKVGAFERQLLGEMKSEGEIIGSIRDSREIKKDVEPKLVAFLDDFTKRFTHA